MDFDQYIHAVGNRCILDIARRGIVERRHNDQDAVGAVGAGLDHLIGVVHEILAQHRQSGRSARRHHEIEMTLKGRGISQYRKTGRASGFIGTRQDRRIEVGANESPGGRSLLHFGDQRIVALSEFLADRIDKIPRRGRSLRQRFDA